ncbi:flavin reductase domain protein FMN-binding protein [Desulfovibrio sp. X2]|uniref:flavin reductase family protein n=1 Tax=Desulfovibrio sp. X2 TaxID=941449 RepID=UPI0003589634|nr:flavin reductase family protein [Desulfovibrio sp. X2]EPR44316.1 flavin reductase domain protein FMN-binding protein [Desulfovibrio sp. X2]
MKKSIGANTYAQPTPTWVVGAYDENGRPNVMVAAWGGICCSKPPCVAVSLRAATHTHGLIMHKRAFTVSVPSEKHLRETDYIGIVSGRDVDKFAKTGLTAARAEHVDAPYVAEFPMVVECRVVAVHELGLHTQFVGEIMDVKVDEDCLDENGKASLQTLRPVLFDTCRRSYVGVGEDLGKAFSVGRGIG